MKLWKFIDTDYNRVLNITDNPVEYDKLWRAYEKKYRVAMTVEQDDIIQIFMTDRYNME